MSDEDWGPWKTHHGCGCPVEGLVVRIKRRDGSIVGPYIAGSVGPRYLTGSPLTDSWVHLPKNQDIIEYQIKKPKGLKMLEELIQNLPAPTKELERI
jgi:hypothetical protein